MPDWSRRLKTIRRWMVPATAAVVLALAAILGERILNSYSRAEILQALTAAQPTRIAAAAVFAAASYFCLTWFDWIALRCVGRPLSWRQAALASFSSLSVGHNVGFAGLSSGAIRYRFYARWGLAFEEVARLVVFCGITVAMGLVSVGGLSLLLNPSPVSLLFGLGPGSVQAVGLLLLLFPLTYLTATCLWTSVPVVRWHVALPPPGLAAAQIGVGSLNYLCVIASLHQLLASSRSIDYFDTAAAYVLANTGVIASHVPGGIGVLESIVLSLLPGAPVLAALLMFRVVYFLAPLAFGLALLASAEIVLKARKMRPPEITPKQSPQES